MKALTKFLLFFLKSWRCLFVLGLLFFSLPSFGQSKAELKLQKELVKLEKSRKQNERLLGQTDKAIENSTYRMALLENQVGLRKRELNGLAKEVALMDEKIGEQQTFVNVLSVDLEEKKQDYTRLVREMYQRRKRGSAWLFILSAPDFRTAYRRYRYLSQTTTFRRKQGQLIQETRADIYRSKERLQQKVDQKKQSLEKQEQGKESLEEDLQSLNTEKKNLKRNRGKIKRRQREIEKERKKVKDEIKEIMASEDRLGDLGFGKLRGRIPPPSAQGPLVRKFGPYRIVGTQAEGDSKGIDIALESGSKVTSVHKGKVVLVSVIPTVGKVMMIDHGGYYCLYSNLMSTGVKVGDMVKRGATLGTVITIKGRTVLHFEIWKDNKALDPQKWLKKWG